MDYLQLRGAEFERKIIKLDSGEGAEILRNRKLILECENEIEKLNNQKSKKANDLEKFLEYKNN